MDLGWQTKLEKFPKTGFLTLPFSIEEKKAQAAYQSLDLISSSLEENQESFASIDEHILFFLKQSSSLSLDQLKKPAVLFKYLTQDTEYYRHTAPSMHHKMFSFHYLEGLYPYLEKQKLERAPQMALDFLRILDELHSEVLPYLSPLLHLIQKKTRCITSLKIWKHLSEKNSQTLLPLHFDRSIFTLILHTQNPNSECLRIFPNKGLTKPEEIFKNSAAFPLISSDFPLMFPGYDAQKLFDLFPTPHYVSAQAGGKTARYSLVFFIGCLR